MGGWRSSRPTTRSAAWTWTRRGCGRSRHASSDAVTAASISRCRRWPPRAWSARSGTRSTRACGASMRPPRWRSPASTRTSHRRHGPAAWCCRRPNVSATSTAPCSGASRSSASANGCTAASCVGVCRAHHGAIQAWHGSWARAERELDTALEDLSTNRPTWRPEALVRLGQPRRRQGRRPEAQHLFAQAASHPVALLGMAALRLDEGDPPAARDLLHRLLRQVDGASRVGRADALEWLVRVELAASDHPAASGTGCSRSVSPRCSGSSPRACRISRSPLGWC